MNREVGLGFHPQPHSFPVLNKPYGFCGRKAPFFFFFFVLGSHFPMNKKLLGDFAALLRGMQSHIQRYNEKKPKEREKEKKEEKKRKEKKKEQKTKTNLTGAGSGCCVLTTLGYPARPVRLP